MNKLKSFLSSETLFALLLGSVAGVGTVILFRLLDLYDEVMGWFGYEYFY